MDLRTWWGGKKGILKHKEMGGSQNRAPGCPLSLAACGDMGTATASLPGKAAPRGWGMGKRSSVEGLMAAVNRSEQRPHRSLLCGAVIRLSRGERGVGLRQQKGKLINKQTSAGNVGCGRRRQRRAKITQNSRGSGWGEGCHLCLNDGTGFAAGARFCVCLGAQSY